MKQYQFQITLKGVGKTAEEGWQDAVEKFILDPGVFKSYNESQPGTEVAIIDMHGNVLGEGFLVVQPQSPFKDGCIEIEDSDIIDVLDEV